MDFTRIHFLRHLPFFLQYNKVRKVLHRTAPLPDFYEYQDEKFDAIVCFDAYPHFMDVPKFVKKANELLKEDGLLAVIHDIGRITLNKHHKRSAGRVSRLLKAPQEEVTPFLDVFKPIELDESDHHYKMVLIKK